jgi:hypothetical protein
MEIRQLIQVGLWTKLLGIYYKKTVIQMNLPFAISAMTNIRNLFSQAIQGIPFTGKTKKKRRRIRHLMNKRNERLLNILPILNELQLSKDSVVCMPKAFYGNTNTR